MRRFAFILIILLLIPGLAFAGSGATDQAASDFIISADSGSGASDGSPSSAFDGTNFLTTWINGTDIYGARISPDGDVLDPAGIPISVGLNGSTSGPRPPSVAFDGTNYLVVWVSTRAGATEIYGCRVSPSGTVIDPAGIQITQGGSPKVKPVGITYSGSEYFIVWRTTGDVVKGIRVGTDGAVMGSPAGFQVISWGFYPTVAYDAADGIYLVAGYRNSIDGLLVNCARVAADGTVLDTTPITLCDAGGNSSYPRIAFDGTNFMVIWTDSRSDSSGCGSLYGARVSPAGEKLGEPFLIAYRVIQNAFANIVFDGTDYLVTWSSTSAWAGEKFRLPDVYAVRIATDGTLLDRQAVPLCTAFAHQSGVSVAYGADRYLAVWNDLGHDYVSGTYAIRGRVFEKGFDSLQTPVEQQALPSEVTWTPQTVGIKYGAASGVATDSGTAWLFGTDDTFALKNGTWNVDAGIGGEFSSYVTGASDIWAGGWAGFVKNYKDGTWSDERPESGSPLITGIWGNSNDDVWASLSYVDAFTHFDGSRWSNVPSACAGDMQDIMGSGPRDIWAVGERGGVQRWNGEAWSAVSVPTMQTLNSVWVNSPSDAFAVGDHGVILHWNGVSWSAMTSPTDKDLKDVWGADSSHIYAVGHCGTVLRYDGTSWNRENAGTTNDLVTVFGGFGSDSTCKLWASGYCTAVYSKTISVSAPVTASPENFRVASATADAVTLAWTLPDSRDITGYDIEYRAEGETDWTVKTVGRVSSYSVTGLDNTKRYSFRLKAQYRYVYDSAATGEIGSGALKMGVHFNSQSGSDVPDCLVDYGGTAVKPPDPTKDGSVFSGWFTDTSFTPDKEWDFDTPVTANIELFARWLDVTVTVRLDTYDGRPPTDVPVARNTAMTRPENPSRDGYAFVDWYTGLDYATKWDFSSPVNDNMTLYAKWIQLVTVRLDTYDGRPPTDVPVARYTAMARPDNPTRDGYTFDDWYTGLDYATKWDFTTSVNDNITLYAKWIQLVTVRLDTYDGRPQTDVLVPKGTAMAKPDDPTRDGYLFVNWYTGTDYKTVWDFSTVLNENITLYAKWISDSVNVQLDNQNGQPCTNISVKRGKAMAMPDNPTRDGYLFDYWYTSLDYTTKWDFGTFITGDMTLYAKWTPDNVNVRFDTQDGQPPTEISVPRGKAIAMPDKPKRDGYTFDDWYTGLDFATRWNFGTFVTGNMTLYARWIPIIVYVNVQLNTQDGQPPTDVSVEKGKTLARPDNPSRDGYTFDDWYTGLDFTTRWNFGTFVNDSMMLYARWINNTYTIEYDANGGTGTTASSSHVYDLKQSLTANGFTRQGYAFKGWSMTRTGAVQYMNGEAVKNLTMANNGTVTLYAIWEEIKIYIVSAAPNNGSYGSAAGGGNYSGGVSVTLTASPYPGYRFLGWMKNGLAVSQSSSYTFTVCEDIWLMAEFAPYTPLALSCTGTNATLYSGCDGTVTVYVSGGDTGTYEYSLNGGVSWQAGNVFGSLAAGTYTAAARDAGYPDNIAACSVTIGQPKFVGSFTAGKVQSKINAGSAISLSPPAAPKGYTVTSVTYSSTNPSVAIVDSSGNVTFLAGGKTTIITTVVSQTVDSKGIVKSKTTTVKKSVTVTQPVASLSLNMYDAAIARTQKVKLAAYIAPVTASNKSVTWKSSNPKVASVSSAGLVTGKAGGTAIITCTAKDGSGASASCTVTVTPVYPAGLKMSKAAVTVKAGKMVSLKATITPKNTDFKALVWQSSNPAVAAVDKNGKVKGLAPGTAVITATTSNGIVAYCTVTVQ